MPRAISAAIPALAAALLALTACKVEVEGAPCGVPGQSADCPSGQACGYDRRCSLAAAAPGCAFCTDGTLDCGGSDVVRCAVDPAQACASWVRVETCAGFVCSSGKCVCPPVAGQVDVDPAAGSIASASPPPTGASSPAACRFKDLADGLASASAWVAGDAARTATVRVRGAPTTASPLVLSVPQPFALPARVKLAAETLATPDAFVLEAPGGTAAAVALGDSSGLEGFTVRATDAAAAHPAGIAVECGSASAPASLRSVLVSGATFTHGIEVKKACSATLEDVRSRKATAAALFVDSPDSQVVVTGGSFGDSVRGVEVRSGKLTLSGPATVTPLYVGLTYAAGSTLEIDSNSEYGILAAPNGASPPPPIDLTIDRALIRDNPGTGVKLFYLPASSAVRIARTEIRKNGKTNAATYGPSPGQRSAGGLLLVSSAPSTFTFERNLVRANGGDQVGVDGSGWNLSGSGTSCPTDATAMGSTFLACGSGGLAVASTSAASSVTAQNDYWSQSPPDMSVPQVVADTYCLLAASVATRLCTP